MNYQSQLKRLVDKQIPTMLGGMHWGEENYSWCKGYQSNVDNGQGSENLFISSVAMTK